MTMEFKLPYTGSEISSKLGKIDGLVEEEERLASEIAVERARITNLATLNEGSTTGDAELADIRVGYGGKTYASAGEAVRTHFSDHANQFNIIEQELYPVEKSLTWEIGGLNSKDATESSLNTRARTNYIELSDISIYPQAGCWCNVFYFDSDKKYISYFGRPAGGIARLLSSTTPENAKYFRLGIGYYDNRIINDVESASMAIVIRGRRDSDIVQETGDADDKVMSQRATTEQFNVIERELYPVDLTGTWEWLIGGVNTADGTLNTLQHRIHTDYNYLSDLSLYIPDGFWGIIYYYTDNKSYADNRSYIGNSGKQRGLVRILTDDTPENAKYFRMMYTYDDGRTINDIESISTTLVIRGRNKTQAEGELKLTFSLGAPNSSNGTMGQTSLRIVSDLTPIQEVFLKPDDGVKIALYYYTANGTYLGMVYPGTSSAMLMELAPENAAYFRVTVGDVDNIELIEKVAEYANKLHIYLPTNEHHFNNFRKSIMANVTPFNEYQSDVPENIGVLNAILNMKQMVEIKYTPLVSIPQQTGDFKAGVERTGLPYSSSRLESLFVPGNVSFHTFMTAIQNPNSYLYTVDLGELGNQNGDTYYGAVCSTACGYALGILPNYSTPQWKNIPNMEVIENQSAYGLKLCDTIVGSGHVVMVTDITRNKRGKIGHITISEAAGAKVQSTNYTPEELEARFPPEIYKYCRYTKLYAVKHEQSEYIAVEDETPQTVTYNTTIIPRKGDKANWLTSQDVVIDVLKIGSYTGVEIYKDNVLLETRAIASVITLSGLQAGSYKARLTDGTTTSDWCYWIVVDAVSSAMPVGSDGKVNVTFSATNATPLWVQWAGGETNGTAHIYELTEEEKAAGTAVCSHQPGSYKVRVAFQTEYGIVHSVLPDEITVI